MPSLWIQQARARALPATAPMVERFTRILVGLTRAVWQPDCTFESAIGAICEAAADGLDADRVSVWQYDQAECRLRCLHAFEVGSGRHLAYDELDTIPLDGGDYIEALMKVRTFDASDAEQLEIPARSAEALRSYLRRHRIGALLDAPAIVSDELQALISHESIDRTREWTSEEATFAATMGDYVAMAYEISRRREAEQAIEHLRLHDAATGLPNRDYMVEMARQRLAVAAKASNPVAVVHVRVDSFNSIASSARAPTTDEVMAAIATRLRRFARVDVELARVRGDGFAFLLSGAGAKRKVVQLAEHALAVVQEMEWLEVLVSPSAAAGIAFAEPAVDARVLLRQAEEAAGRARAGNKFRYEVYEEGHHDALVEGLRFERELRNAFAEGQFEVHYQPEFDAVSNEWVAAEALVRRRVGGELIAAAEFIGVAESSGLILPLGSWVLHTACREAASWPTTAAGVELSVRINVSARQFDEGDVVDDVRAALASSGLPPWRLSLEITETTLMHDLEHAKVLLDQIKGLGVGVAIDDFGTGYASLTYLKQLPIHVLKIDRSFVECLPEGVVDAAIVRALVGLASSLHMEVVAEGVELERQLHSLLGMGVRRMQGWRYGKAMPQAEWCRVLAAPFAPGGFRPGPNRRGRLARSG